MDCWPDKTSNLNITHWALGDRNGPFSLFSDNLSAVAHSMHHNSYEKMTLFFPLSFFTEGNGRTKAETFPKNVSSSTV